MYAYALATMLPTIEVAGPRGDRALEKAMSITASFRDLIVDMACASLGVFVSRAVAPP